MHGSFGKDYTINFVEYTLFSNFFIKTKMAIQSKLHRENEFKSPHFTKRALICLIFYIFIQYLKYWQNNEISENSKQKMK